MQMNLRLRIETPRGRHQNRNCLPGPGGARKQPTNWPCDVRLYRGRDSSLGFRTELENLACEGKGKGTSGSPVRPQVPMRKPGADCSIGALSRSNSRGAKGAGHPYGSESTGNRRNSMSGVDGRLPWVARAG